MTLPVASGLPFVLLRNGAYTEMYTDTLGPAIQYGAILGSAGDGKLSAATRADLAAEVSRQTGKHIACQDMPTDAYARALTAAGIPESLAGLLADTSLAIAHGDWYTDSTDLQQLTGRPSTPLADAVAAALKTGPALGLDPRG